MKNCTVWGDLMSDKSSENYPEVAVCDSCAQEQKCEEGGVVSVDSECNEDYESCHYCQKTKEEEDEELGRGNDESDI